jgi:hypothetical protein
MKSFSKSPDELSARVRSYLRRRIVDADLTYAQLAERLNRHGYVDENENTVTMKMRRGKFSAAFFLAALAALGETEVRLRDV